jgi:hypothetical protein
MAGCGEGRRLSAEVGDCAEGLVGTVPRGLAGEGWQLGYCHGPDPVNNVISKLFKKNSKRLELIQSKEILPLLQKFQIKY